MGDGLGGVVVGRELHPVVDVALHVVVDLVAAGVRRGERDAVARRPGHVHRHAELFGQRLLLRLREAEDDVPLVRGGAEGLGDLRRLAQAAGRGLVDCGVGHLGEQAHPVLRVVGVLGVRVAQGHVDDVVGRDRRGPVGHRDRPGELEQRGEPRGVDRHHAVDRADPGLGRQALQHLGDAREVGGEVHVLQRGLGMERGVAADVVGWRLPHDVGEGAQRGVPLTGAHDLAHGELAVVGGDHRVAAGEAARGARLRVVGDDEQVVTRAGPAEERGGQLGRVVGVARLAWPRASCRSIFTTASCTGAAR